MTSPEQVEIATFLQEAVARHQRGDLAGAEALYRQVLALQPANFDALHLLGLARLGQGQPGEAVAFINAALRINPGVADAYVNLGAACSAAGERDAALAAYRHAVTLNPNHAMALNNLGALLYEAGRHQEAVVMLMSALAVDPNHADATANLSVVANGAFNALIQQKNYAEAWKLVGQLAATQPREVWVLNRLAQLQFQLSCHDDAIATLERALSIEPDNAEILAYLGLFLGRAGREAEALRYAKRSVEVAPQSFSGWSMLGLLMMELGRDEETIEAFDRALALDPASLDVRYNRSLSLLALGRYREGWQDYALRYRTSSYQRYRRDPGCPLWDGSPLAGRSILILAEQGLGDVLQFVRYAPLLKARGGRVILECHPALKRLLEHAPGVDAIAVWGEPLPPADVHIPLMSLPLVCGTELATIPFPQGYLTAQSALDFARTDALTVGLVWSGNKQVEARRSIPFEQLEPLFALDGVDFVNLQYGAEAEEPAAYPWAGKLRRPAMALTDLAATAAVAARLDLVITIDTSAAHLCGALGLPVWTLVMQVPDWRWLREGSASPWYRSMRLFRQRTQGDWSPTIAEAAAALAELSDAQARGAGHPALRAAAG